MTEWTEDKEDKLKKKNADIYATFTVNYTLLEAQLLK